MTVSARDLAVSRRMQGLARRLRELVKAELGEEMGFGLVVFPWADSTVLPLKPGEPAEFQYISNAPRGYMHGALKRLVEKWDAGHVDVPPHEKS